MNWIELEKQMPPKNKDEILFNISGISDQGEVGSYIVFAQYHKEKNKYYWAYHPAYCRNGAMAKLDGCDYDDIEDYATHWMPLELPFREKQ